MNEDCTYRVFAGQVWVHGDVVLLTVMRVAAGRRAVHRIRPRGQGESRGAKERSP